MSTKNFLGEKYGRLTVVARLGMYAECLCDCGAKTTPRMDKLRAGLTKSCGCLAAELAAQVRRPKAPKTPKRKPTADESRLRAVWSAMLQRCTNPSNGDWERYGGRGIRVCETWAADKNAFLDWALPRYRKGLWLERVDNDGPYSPENCQFASGKRQGRNRSNTLWVDTPNGQRALSQVAAKFGVPYRSAYAKYWQLVASGETPKASDFSDEQVNLR